MKQSIVHIALVVRDYDEAIEFYAKKLHFTLVEEWVHPNFPCIGSRDEESNQRLRDAMKRGTWGSVQSLRREWHEPSDTF